MHVIDVIEELSRHPEGSFLSLLSFNGSSIGACDIKGESPVWEMHPDTDEFFFILEGQFDITLLDGDTPSHHSAGAGSTFVVPAGVWHKPAAPRGCKFIHITPGESLHSEADDPREKGA